MCECMRNKSAMAKSETESEILTVSSFEFDRKDNMDTLLS